MMTQNVATQEASDLGRGDGLLWVSWIVSEERRQLLEGGRRKKGRILAYRNKPPPSLMQGERDKLC